MYQGGMYVIIGSPFGPLEGNTQQVEITLSKCLRVWQQVFERWTHCCLADIWRNITFNVIFTITNSISKSLPSSGTNCLPIMTYTHPHEYHICTVFSCNNYFTFARPIIYERDTILFNPNAAHDHRMWSD